MHYPVHKSILIHRLFMSSKFKLIVGGVVTYASAVAIGYYYTSSKKPSHPPHAGPCKSGGAVALEDSKRQNTYASLAKKYDTGKHSPYSLFHEID